MENGRVSEIIMPTEQTSELCQEGKENGTEKTQSADHVQHTVHRPAMTRYVIRQGRIEDCSQISSLMRKLAESEDYGDRVQVTEEDLRRDGFGKNPVFESIVLADRECNDDAAVVGYALFFMGFCSWNGRLLYLEDVFISQQYRGTGLGIALLHELAKIAIERGCKLVQGTVVEWNKPAMDLYTRIGAHDMTVNEKYHLFSIKKDFVEKLAKAKIPVLNNGSQIVMSEI